MTQPRTKSDVLKTLLDIFNGVNYSIISRRPFGTNIFDRDWDLLLVMDACRVDAMREVAPEYDFIDNVDAIWSVGSSSHEWITQTFHQRHADKINNTAHISTNPFAPRTFVDGRTPPYKSRVDFGSFAWDPVSVEQFAYFEQISLDKTSYSGTLPPNVLTDRVIDVGRDREYDRTVAHYFQPHVPFLSRPDDPTEEPIFAIEKPYHEYERGEMTYEELWDAYLENLRVGLDSVGVLLENFDAEKVVITADHGQLIGEFGLTGHPPGIPHPALKRVPWVETSASDDRTYEPDSERSELDTDTEQRLKNLGYI